MQTIDTDHNPLAAKLPFLRKLRFMQSEDTTLATLASWSFGLVIFTLAGFYLGSIAGHDNHPKGPQQDLNIPQLQTALYYGAAGLALGVVFALLITFWYTPIKLRELEREQGGH